MKKFIISSAFILALASCSAPATEEQAPTTDSVAVECVDTSAKAESTVAVKVDTVKVDTVKVK